MAYQMVEQGQIYERGLGPGFNPSHSKTVVASHAVQGFA